MVIWQNFGNQTHSANANLTLNVGLPPFNTGTIAPGGSSSYSFAQTGSYHYYDSTYKWMTGIVYVLPAPPPPPPPPPTSNQVGLDGSINWTVVGLSSDQVNLNVSHQIGIHVSIFIPVTESGNFEQSINLSTRVESPSTATSVVKALLASLLPALSGGSLLATGGPGPILQTMLSGQSNSPDHTQWWVNGPLSLGSPVQIFRGWSSVTGNENLNLGGSIGTRSAWIVTSQLSQTLSVTMPNQSNPFGQPSTAMLAASLKFLWSYDKNVDLLLRNNDTLNVAIHSVTPTTIYTSCGQFGCTPVPVTVTRDMALTISLALRLHSTTIHLVGSPSPTSTLMSLMAALPWMTLGIGGLAAGVAVALIVWFTRRTKVTSMPGPAPTTTPSSPPATPP